MNLQKKVKVVSKECMSDRDYKRDGKPKWWIKLAMNDEGVFFNDFEKPPGNDFLDVEIIIPNNITLIIIGVGSLENGIREKIQL